MSEEFHPYEIVDGDFNKGLILLCDHARNTLPPAYGNLGLPPSELKRHIAFDIGAEEVFRDLAARLQVPGVMAKFSRLLIDPNRSEDDPTLVRQLYDGTIIPGNYPLGKDEFEKRIDHYFRPYHLAIDQMLKRFDRDGIVPVVISIHSMTDQWNGEKRPWEISILWDNDPRLSSGLLEALRQNTDLKVGDNQPYDGALGGDTMYTHCTLNGLSHSLIEFRQDLVATQKDIDKWVNLLVPIIEKLNQLPHNHEKQLFGSRADI